MRPGSEVAARGVVDQVEDAGQTAVLVLVDDAPVAVLAITDQLRPAAAETVAALAAHTGTVPVLLTGDNRRTAAGIAAAVGIGDVRAGLLPEDKVTAIEALRGEGQRVLAVGDRVNDAPALAAADVGAAMGGAGADLTLHAAGVVIVRDELDTLPGVLGLARRARRVVIANLVIAAAVITGLVVWDLLGHLPLPLGVAGHESEPQQAADLVAAMEPDEAVDALRDLSGPESDELLERMPAQTREHLSSLLGYPEDEAGGFMTTVLVRATETDTVTAVRRRIGEQSEHRAEIDAVAVCDSAGCLIADVALIDLLVAADTTGDTTEGITMSQLIADNSHTHPVVVGTDADVEQVAVALVDSRRSSLLVVDDAYRPLGRILADDVLDALTPDTGRRHFPRLLR